MRERSLMRWLRLLSVIVGLLLSSGRALCAQSLTEGFLVLDRWVSLKEAQEHVPPSGAWQIEDPWIRKDMLNTSNGEPLRIGSYWYRLPTLAPGQHQIAFDFLNHSYSATLWTSTRLSSAIKFGLGQPGLAEDNERRRAARRVVTFNVEDQTESWFLLINFSHQSRNSGGLWSHPRVGQGDELEAEKNLRTYLLFTCIGSLLILMIYMLMIYVRRRDDKPSLFIALMCLGSMMRIIGVELILCELFDPPNSSWPYNFSRRLEYMSIAMANLSFLPFIITSFPRVRLSRKILWTLILISFGYLVSCTFVSMQGLTDYLPFIQLTCLSCLGCILYILVQAIKSGERGARFMLIASLLPLCAFALEIFHSRSGGNVRVAYFAGIIFIFMLSQFLASRFAQAYNQVDHAFTEMSKMVYSHQVTKIRNGEILEATMPTATSQACVISFDIVGSSKIQHVNVKKFFRNVFTRCNEIISEGYDGRSLKANAYRIKEMGDGFLCSVGYPFEAWSDNFAHDSVDLAKRFARVLTEEAEMLHSETPIACGIGIAIDAVTGFYPDAGTKEYDLYGPAIVLATRYEGMRKTLFEAEKGKSVLIIQEKVFQSLDPSHRAGFIAMDLKEIGVVVRDDPAAVKLYYQFLNETAAKDETTPSHLKVV